MPSPQHSTLWQKLQLLDLDGEASLPFSKRLARDNGWSHDFALRVVDELKRFYFLAATCGHLVTPSDEVDQAWHLHLVYTRSYWDDLCGEILGFPLHHGPTKGGKSEGDKFVNWYDKTLASYRAAFQEEPPHDIWPDAAIRFGEAPYFRRVNVRRAWLVRKPFAGAPYSGKGSNWKHLSLSSAMPGRFAWVLLLLLFAGCAAPSNWNVSTWNGAEFLGAFWTACAVVVALALFLRSRERRPLDPVFPTAPLDAYEVARLKDGGTWAVDVAIGTLHTHGALGVTPGGILYPTGAPTNLSPFEREVLGCIGSQSPISRLHEAAKTGALRASIAAMDQKLTEAGLLLSPEAQKALNRAPLGITFALLAVGVLRIFVGMARDRPVGFLVITCIAIAAFAVWLFTSLPRRSGRGDLLLNALKLTHSAPVPTRSSQVAPTQSSGVSSPQSDVEATAFYLALAGTAAFPPELRPVIAPHSGGDGGSSSGGGDGGGDGGSDGGGGGCGGGGCGGCGGS